MLCLKEIFNNFIKDKDCNLFLCKRNIVLFEFYLSLFCLYRFDIF